MEELLNEIMESPRGREFIMKLLDYTGVEQGGFNPDPYGNAWLMGRVSVGAALLNCMRSSERGAELEAIMRREARHPPDSEDWERDYDY